MRVGSGSLINSDARLMEVRSPDLHKLTSSNKVSRFLSALSTASKAGVLSASTSAQKVTMVRFQMLGESWPTKEVHQTITIPCSQSNTSIFGGMARIRFAI